MLWDFLPTACELAGVEAPEDIEGLSYAPTLTGKGEQKKHEQIYWEFLERDGRRALRMGDWKLVQYGLKPGRFGTPRLFDLSRDIGEKQDLADRHPDRVREMVGRMNRARVPSERFGLPGLDALE